MATPHADSKGPKYITANWPWGSGVVTGCVVNCIMGVLVLRVVMRPVAAQDPLPSQAVGWPTVEQVCGDAVGCKSQKLRECRGSTVVQSYSIARCGSETAPENRNARGLGMKPIRAHECATRTRLGWIHLNERWRAEFSAVYALVSLGGKMGAFADD
jgi:hypothetical protein